MSNIKFEEISVNGYTPKKLRDILNSTYDGKRFMLSKHDKKLYYALKRFVTRYNAEHVGFETSFPELVKVLTGKDYVVNLDEYHIAKIKEAMDEDGNVLYISQDTRSFLKNKYRNAARRCEENQMHSISEIIAELVPGAKYVTSAQRSRHFSNRKTLIDSIIAVTNNDGCIELVKDANLRRYLLGLSETHATTIEQEIENLGFKNFTIRMAYDNSKILANHRANILKCIDSKNNIVNLTKKYPATHKYVTNLAVKNQCSISYAINQILGDEYQLYTYRGAHNKLSKYSFENPEFIGDDPKVRSLIVRKIRECMDENNIVSGMYKNRSVESMVNYIATFNNMSLTEVYAYFVPEAKYIQRNAPVMKHTTKEDVLNNLRLFDDGSGCVDSVRKYKKAMKGLKKFADEEGLHISEFVVRNSKFYFSASHYEIDYIDFVVQGLIEKYGYGADVSGLSTENPKLYNAVRKIKNFFPGGAKTSMEETFSELGFSYRGFKRDSKYTESYVRQLLKEYYGNSKVIESLYENKTIGTAIINYSGKIGKSVKETVESFGYEYYNCKPKSERLTSKKMTLEEYKKYSEISEHDKI